MCPNHEDAVYESTPDEGLKGVLSIGCSDLPMNKFANEGAIHFPPEPQQKILRVSTHKHRTKKYAQPQKNNSGNTVNPL